MPEPDPVEEKLDRIQGFSAGWHFGDGVPIRPDALLCVRYLYRSGKALNLVADVFPHEDGDLSVMFKMDTHYLEVLCLPDMKFSLTQEEGVAPPFTLVKELEEVPLADIYEELFKFAKLGYLWDFSDFSTRIDTVSLSNGLPLRASITPLTMLTEPHSQKMNAGLALSMLIAYASVPPPNRSANIFETSMEEPVWLESLSSIGLFPTSRPTSKWTEKMGLQKTHATEILKTSQTIKAKSSSGMNAEMMIFASA